jgi:hypothetical protein
MNLTPEEAIRLTDSERIAILAESLLEGELGGKDYSDEEKRFLVHRWLLRVRGQLADAICGDDRIMAINKSSDELMLTATIADVLIQAKLHVSVPMSVLAAQITSLGIKWVCGPDEDVK